VRDDEEFNVDVWRSVATLIEGDVRLSRTAFRMLAILTASAMGAGGTPPDDFVDGLRELHRHHWIGIRDGVAYPAMPAPGPLGLPYPKPALSKLEGFQSGDMGALLRGGMPSWVAPSPVTTIENGKIDI
jgi:hypothetical protein